MIDKIYAYYKQDRKKNRLPDNIYKGYQSHVSDLNLKVDDITDLIKKNGLNCTYCYKALVICPNKEQRYQQLTLDRIDDFLDHGIDNVVLCCLKCNIKKAIIAYDISFDNNEKKINICNTL